MCFVLIFLNCIFHWGVTALQYSVGFCCISAWISHGYTYVPWRRKWQPTPVILPGESREQWTLAGYSLWGGRVGHDLATKPYMCPLPLESPSHPSRLSQSPSLSSLSHTANCHWLSVLHMVVYVCVCVYMYKTYIHMFYVLPGESQGWGSLVGCRLWGRTESDTTEVT